MHACRYAQDLLREAGVTLVLNLKPELLERLARCLGTKVGNAHTFTPHTLASFKTPFD